jgi:hypothetical protein
VNHDFVVTRNSTGLDTVVVLLLDDDILSLRFAAVRAAIANNVRTGLTAIGNERIQAPAKTGRGAQVANGLWHDAGNGRFMQREDAEHGKVADGFGDGSGKEVVVNLQKFHVHKHANVVDAARHLIIVQIELRQGGETQEFRGQTARQLIKVKILYKEGKHTHKRST